VHCSRFLVTGKALSCKESACHGFRTISRSKTARLLQQNVTGAAVFTVDFEGARFENRIAATARATVGYFTLLFFI